MVNGTPPTDDAVRSIRPAVTPAAHRRVLVLAGVLTAVVLVLTAGSQIYDANLYVMAEATALLAGDRAGRDFFPIGAPLETHLAAAAQLASGGLLLAEFIRQWLYIVAGVVVAFHLGLRLSRSVAASLVMLLLTLIILANTPTYHSSKLLFFPLFLWAAWRFLDRPDVRRSAVLGAISALAFLSRHDYGFYVGFGSCVALAVPPLAAASPRRLRSMVANGAAYGAAVLLVLAPWAVSVQTTEGLVEYTRLRVALFDSARQSPYRALLRANPVRALKPEPLPPPEAAVVQFMWRPDIDEAQRQELEQQFGLRALDDRDDRDRLRYEVSTAADVRFLELEPYIRDPYGFPWDRLREARSRLPSQANVNEWLLQVTLLMPLVLMAAGGWGLWRQRGQPGDRIDFWRMMVAGAFLAVVNGALFREPGYVVVTVPLVAALSARFVADAPAPGRAVAIALLLVTMLAAAVWARRAPIFLPSELPDFMASASARLFASPSAAAETRYQYLYECTSEGDRLLITGSTPSLVSYYAERPMAGGHSYWHHGWLADPASQARSLELLQRQSVPFAVSTHDPVLDDFKAYPLIREYLEQHYRPLEGTNGTVLVDTRRQPTGQPFGPLGYPCFQ